MVVSPFRFPKFIPKSVTSNPLSQILTSNPRSQPDTDFAVDMFPYKKTGAFQMSGLTSQLPKKPGNTPLSGTYLSFLDINTTHSTCGETLLHINIRAQLMTFIFFCTPICKSQKVAPFRRTK